MSEQDDSFLSRWSRRKAAVRQGAEVPAAPAAVVVPFPAPAARQDAPAAILPATGAAIPAAPVPPAALPGAAGAAASQQAPAEAPPPPTLEDVEALTPESDFSRFIQRDVDVKVKNSAMKKLFSDPHYNVMDGLDTYIDDYNTPDPLPKAMLRQLVQARMLGLLDDELPEQPTADEARAGVVADAASVGPEAADPPGAGEDPAPSADGPVALEEAPGNLPPESDPAASPPLAPPVA